MHRIAVDPAALALRLVLDSILRLVAQTQRFALFHVIEKSGALLRRDFQRAWKPRIQRAVNERVAEEKQKNDWQQ